MQTLSQNPFSASFLSTTKKEKKKKAVMRAKILEKDHTRLTRKELSHHCQNTGEHARLFSWIFSR